MDTDMPCLANPEASSATADNDGSCGFDYEECAKNVEKFAAMFDMLNNFVHEKTSSFTLQQIAESIRNMQDDLASVMVIQSVYEHGLLEIRCDSDAKGPEGDTLPDLPLSKLQHVVEHVVRENIICRDSFISKMDERYLTALNICKDASEVANSAFKKKLKSLRRTYYYTQNTSFLAAENQVGFANLWYALAKMLTLGEYNWHDDEDHPMSDAHVEDCISRIRFIVGWFGLHLDRALDCILVAVESRIESETRLFAISESDIFRACRPFFLHKISTLTKLEHRLIQSFINLQDVLGSRIGHFKDHANDSVSFPSAYFVIGLLRAEAISIRDVCKYLTEDLRPYFTRFRANVESIVKSQTTQNLTRVGRGGQETNQSAVIADENTKELETFLQLQKDSASIEQVLHGPFYESSSTPFSMVLFEALVQIGRWNDAFIVLLHCFIDHEGSSDRKLVLHDIAGHPPIACAMIKLCQAIVHDILPADMRAGWYQSITRSRPPNIPRFMHLSLGLNELYCGTAYDEDIATVLQGLKESHSRDSDLESTVTQIKSMEELELALGVQLEPGNEGVDFRRNPTKKAGLAFVLSILGVHASKSILFCTQLLRLGLDQTMEVSHGIASFLLEKVLLPAQSVMRGCTALDSEIWTYMTSRAKLNYEQRYDLYVSYRNNVMCQSELVSVSNTALSVELKRHLRRFVPDRVEQYSVLLGKLAHHGAFTVFETIITTIKDMDNMIDSLSDALSRLSLLSYDILVFCCLRHLGDMNNNKLKADGVNMEAWFANLSRFLIQIFRKHPSKVDIVGCLNVIYYHINNSDPLMIELLKGILSDMCGIVQSELVTQKELDALGAYPMMREYVSKNARILGYYNLQESLSRIKLHKALTESSLTGYFGIALAKHRDNFWAHPDYDEWPLRMLSKISDRFQDVLNLYLNAIRLLESIRRVDFRAYQNKSLFDSIPGIHELVCKHKVSIELAFHLNRDSLKYIHLPFVNDISTAQHKLESLDIKIVNEVVDDLPQTSPTEFLDSDENIAAEISSQVVPLDRMKPKEGIFSGDDEANMEDEIVERDVIPSEGLAEKDIGDFENVAMKLKDEDTEGGGEEEEEGELEDGAEGVVKASDEETSEMAELVPDASPVNDVYEPVLEDEKSQNRTISLEEIRSLKEDKELWADLSEEFFCTFWVLSLPDISGLSTLYEEAENAISKDMLSRRSEEEKREIFMYKCGIRAESKKHGEVNQKTMDLLRLRAKDMFQGLPETIHSKGISERCLDRFIQHCWNSRCMFSLEDAKFCFKFLNLFDSYRLPAMFDSLEFLEAASKTFFFLVSSRTESEARRFSYFLKDSVKRLEVFRTKPASFKAGNIKLAWVAKFKQDGSTWTAEERHQEFCLAFQRIHVNIMHAVHRCLEDEEFVVRRNAVIVLNAVVELFPRLEVHTRTLEQLLAKLSEDSSEEAKLMLTSYSVMLGKQKHVSKLSNEDFLSGKSGSTAREIFRPLAVPETYAYRSAPDGDNKGAASRPTRGDDAKGRISGGLKKPSSPRKAEGQDSFMKRTDSSSNVKRDDGPWRTGISGPQPSIQSGKSQVRAPEMTRRDTDPQSKLAESSRMDASIDNRNLPLPRSPVRPSLRQRSPPRPRSPLRPRSPQRPRAQESLPSNRAMVQQEPRRAPSGPVGAQSRGDDKGASNQVQTDESRNGRGKKRSPPERLPPEVFVPVAPKPGINDARTVDLDDRAPKRQRPNEPTRQGFGGDQQRGSDREKPREIREFNFGPEPLPANWQQRPLPRQGNENSRSREIDDLRNNLPDRNQPQQRVSRNEMEIARNRPNPATRRLDLRSTLLDQDRKPGQTNRAGRGASTGGDAGGHRGDSGRRSPSDDNRQDQPSQVGRDSRDPPGDRGRQGRNYGPRRDNRAIRK